MSEIDLSPIEGVVVEHKGTTVGELIEKLQKLDPNLIICTVDTDYGENVELEPFENTVNQWQRWLMQQTNLRVGDKYIQID
jgi:hypothetical protein